MSRRWCRAEPELNDDSARLGAAQSGTILATHDVRTGTVRCAASDEQGRTTMKRDLELAPEHTTVAP